MSDQQLQSRQRVDTISPDDTPFAIRMRRIQAVSRNALDELLKSKTATIGAIMMIFLLSVCILTPILATHSPIKTNYRIRLEPASAEHYFGTDKFGRDIYSRVLWGGQRIVLISLAAVTFGLILGIPLGVFAGFFGGRFDAISMRFVDGLIAFPGLLLYLLIFQHTLI